MTTAPQSKSESRRAPRIAVDTRVEARVTTSAITTRLRGRALDLSPAGMGCLLAEELPPGQSAILEFSLPLCPDRFRLNAVVRHRRGSRHGLEFHGLPEHQQKELERACEVLPKLKGL